MKLRFLQRRFQLNPKGRRQKMKTIKCAILMFALAIFGACGDSDNDNSSNQTTTVPRDKHVVTLILGQNGALNQIRVEYAHDSSGNPKHMVKSDSTPIDRDFLSVGMVEAFLEGKCENHLLLRAPFQRNVIFTINKFGDLTSAGIIVQGSERYYLDPAHIVVNGPTGLISVDSQGTIAWGSALTSSPFVCRDILGNQIAPLK